MNLYAYCLNNPVMGYDPEGTSVLLLLAIGALIGAGISATTSAITQKVTTGDVNGWVILSDAVFGGISGAISASGIGIWGQAGLGVITSLANTFIDSAIIGKGEPTVEEVLFSGLVGGIAGALGGNGLTHGAKNSFKGLVKNVTRDFGKSFSKGIQSLGRHLGKHIAKLGMDIIKPSIFTFVANNAKYMSEKIWEWLSA